MTDIGMSPSEVIGFDESDGCLRVRLRTTTVQVLDHSGRPVIVSDPAIRGRLFPDPADRPNPIEYDEFWDPWRQGP